MDNAPARRFPVPVRPNPTRRVATIWLALLLALVTTPLVGLAGHAQDADAATAIRPRITGIKPLTKEVYGYLPYWRLDSGTADRLQYDYVSTIAFFGLGILADGNIDTVVGRLQGIRRRRRRGRHQRGPRQGRPGRPDVPAVRQRRAPQDDRVPRQRRRPGHVHRPGARPDGRPQGGRREPRLRADVRRDDARLPRRSWRSCAPRCRPASPAPPWSTPRPPARARRSSRASSPSSTSRW